MMKRQPRHSKATAMTASATLSSHDPQCDPRSSRSQRRRQNFLHPVGQWHGRDARKNTTLYRQGGLTRARLTTRSKHRADEALSIAIATDFHRLLVVVETEWILRSRCRLDKSSIA